jgi:hypothetical protein
MVIHQDAMTLKYSADKSQLLTSDNKVFAIKSTDAKTYTFATHADNPDLTSKDPSLKKPSICIQVKVWDDDKGHWHWEVTCSG